MWKALVLHELRPEDRQKVAVRAWQWLFMVVPLVSTTFASLGRMLGDIDEPRLGWVIVDEAGQATPQSAAGAMMRFQHAVVVGDPDQLQPVVALPDELLDRVAAHRGAPAQASSSRCSVQLLADAANPFGTVRNGRWVGLPLLVHNRCVDPMFALANTIAYQGRMVQGRLDDPDTVPAPLGPSRWIDVPLVGGTHWSDKSRVAVRGLLEKLRPVAADPEQFVSVALLAPFRAVVAELRTLREDFLQSLGLDPDGAAEEGQAAAVTALGLWWRGLDESPVDRLTAGTVLVERCDLCSKPAQWRSRPGMSSEETNRMTMTRWAHRSPPNRPRVSVGAVLRFRPAGNLKTCDPHAVPDRSSHRPRPSADLRELCETRRPTVVDRSSTAPGVLLRVRPTGLPPRPDRLPRGEAGRGSAQPQSMLD